MVKASPPPPDAPLPDLLKFANRAGVTFRLAGNQIRVTAPQDETLRPVLAALKAQQPTVWDILGGSALDAPSLELITRLGVEEVVPRTAEEALQLIAEMEADLMSTPRER